ncbi:MAG: glycosyltransferase [Leptospiraceae bacterium]|nr:glycosyltransferase [Leptospiraceae bacterium]
MLRFTIGIFYPLAQARIGVSNGVAKDIEKLGRLKENSVRVIYNPIVKDEEDIEKDFINPWDKSTAKKILTVGNLKIEKNHELLIRAFAKVKKTINAVLVILGEGELRKKMEDLIHELNLSDSVKLPGYVPNPYPWYKNADLFVLSSNHEGFGNVIVEALSCGIPVVSTNCPSGPGEILESGKYGILVPVNDSNAMAAAIIKSLNMEHDKVKLENRANDFSTENIGEKYLELMFG